MQQRSAERLNALLDAAAEVVDEVGFDRVTTAMIAERAGASIGTVYRYFPDRVAVLHALRDRSVQRFRLRVANEMIGRNPSNWWDAIDCTVTAFVDLYRTEAGFRIIHFADRERAPLPGEDIEAGFFAYRLANVLAEEFGLPGGPELTFRLEVIVEMADALLSRAFVTDPHGDERFIAECRSIMHAYLVSHYGTSSTHSPDDGRARRS
ncbi:TetR family transcriptional regulator [Luethyella okanaganae]|uniref:TetR family transcriptional regulator n=1 Tax=Luethyella okanaganae TaxID=69372 RepID=A0ABW1VD44_9MICO